MRNLNLVAKECMAELDAIGIKYGRVLSFEVNTRAKSRWGQCKKVPGGYSINISSRLLRDTTPIRSLKNTIIHELLHTCNGAYNHKTEWKRLAEKVNRHYGYGIKRTSTEEEKGVKREKVQPKKIKHKFICKGCGMEILRVKESRFTKDYNAYTCGRCGGMFEKIF